MIADGAERALLVAAATLFAAALLSIALLDIPVAEWAATLGPDLRAVAAIVTRIGESRWYLIPLAFAAVALWLAAKAGEAERAAQRRRLMWAAIFLFLAIAFPGLIVDILKILFGRARPILLEREHFTGWVPFTLKPKLHSFPSGHTTTMVALAAALGVLVPRLRWPLYALAIAVALTRIVLGQHYLADNLGAAALALVTTVVLTRIFARRGLIAPQGTRNPS